MHWCRWGRTGSDHPRSRVCTGSDHPRSCGKTTGDKAGAARASGPPPLAQEDPRRSGLPGPGIACSPIPWIRTPWSAARMPRPRPPLPVCSSRRDGRHFHLPKAVIPDQPAPVPMVRQVDEALGDTTTLVALGVVEAQPVADPDPPPPTRRHPRTTGTTARSSRPRSRPALPPPLGRLRAGRGAHRCVRCCRSN